jgi:thiol-disulfide isomerase/thioredoxin
VTGAMSRAFAFALGAITLCAATPVLAFEFKPYARGSFADLRKAHAGRPLLVHFWSVTCPPCLAELPDWAKIAHEKKNIDIIFVNADRENDHGRAESRLDKAGLKDAAHYGFADEFVDRLYFEVDHYWRGELPFTALVGPDGGIVTVTGPIDDPLIGRWLAKTEKP